MKKVVSKALSGAIPLNTMKAKLNCILYPLELSVHNYNNSESAEPLDETIDNIEGQPNSYLPRVSSKIANESNCIEVLDDKKTTEENANVTLIETTSKHLEDTTGRINVESNGIDNKDSISEADFSIKLKGKNNSSMESKMNEISNHESGVDQTDRKFLEFFLTFELFCLEMAEQDFEFTVSNKLNAIQYFIEVLNGSLLKDWSVSSLHGTIGKASAEVSSFLNKKYKGDKFESFFQHQTEFIVDGPFVKLSPSYQETFSKRRTALSVSVNQNSKWDLLKLYKSNCYKEVSKEVGAIFLDICSFLENKSTTKLSRLEGIATHFPKCLEWIKVLDGATLAKKIGRFLGLFSIFEIFDDDYIYFSQKEYCDTIVYFFEKTIQNKKIDLLHLLGCNTFMGSNSVKGKSYTNAFELSKDSCYLLEKAIENKIPIRYCEVVKILPTPLLLEIYNIGIGTIIDTMLKIEKFYFQNGKIEFKSDQNLSFCLKNGTNNSLISNEEFKTGSNTTFQQTDEMHYVQCNNCDSTLLYDSKNNSYTLCEVSQSSTPVRIFSDSDNCNKNQLELLNSELVRCNSPTLNSNEEIKIESMNDDTQILSQNSNTMVSEEDCTSDFVNVFKDADKPVSQNTMEYNSEEEYDSLVADYGSVASLCETHSLSSLEDELTYTNEENNNTSNENGMFAEIRCLDDACVSSQILDSHEENNLLSKDIQYIDLLNEDDELSENIDTNENSCIINKTLLNHSLIGSQTLLANNLNLYQSETKAPSLQNISAVLNCDQNETDYLKVKVADCKISGNKSENIAVMKQKAELLAKEVSGTVPIDNEATISSNDSNSLNDLKLTVNENLSHSSDIPAEVTFQDLSHPKKNSHPLEISLNNCKDILVEYPLQQEFNCTNKNKIIETAKLGSINGEDSHGNYYLPEEVDSTNSSNLNINLSSNNTKPDPTEYPLQPILAKVVLLTADSCIAVAEIESRKQNIYFLKCVFVCDHQYCCSDCFNNLKVSDTVSCFVPSTEMSRKMWIAIMVSEETSTQFEEIDSFNEVLRKQNEGGCMNRNMCVNSKNVSIQTEHHCLEFGCQTETSSTEQACQTHLGGDVKLCAVTEDSTSQTNVSVKSASIQTANDTKSSECQTNFSFDQLNVESQTNFSGDIKESPTCADVLCQTDLTGEVKLTINVVNTECQTISTGQVMITKYYHM